MADPFVHGVSGSSSSHTHEELGTPVPGERMSIERDGGHKVGTTSMPCGSGSGTETASRRIPVGKGITEMDRDGDGFVDTRDMRAFATGWRKLGHRNLLLRRAVLGLACFSCLLLFGMFGTAWWAIRLNKDMHVQGDEITGPDGQVLSTIQKLDKFDGVELAEVSRRLQGNGSDSNSTNGTNVSNGTTPTVADDILTGSNGTDQVEIDHNIFTQAYSSYKNGKASWIARLPDGTYRTIIIDGVDSQGAWGSCASCSQPNRLIWRVSCGLTAVVAAPEGSKCVVTWDVQQMMLDPSAAFLARRRALAAEEEAPVSPAPHPAVGRVKSAATLRTRARLAELMRTAQALQDSIVQLQMEQEEEEEKDERQEDETESSSVAQSAPQQSLLARSGRRMGGVGRGGGEQVDRVLSGKNCV
mmetsp:Transcript_54596/g.123369  ORF Transcript_54596/g.123369 Transcript_54596/m.123369 type:complete len:414 (+) Transcript_54596:77-1318(+)|eukprot:CAMPEP_0180700288 /NCGR_PEP_ID=MMETSP1038_2-20121128/4993_1 /TAXON_ID=632150 /ORGANISM="Azadinium spinosum, Strain 3D9" /LENGTH=413 /DNA_ID=CAMNT_0022731945 /DNA_START=54 /DNA_END=1295 /DNA_ORIENTATION=+